MVHIVAKMKNMHNFYSRINPKSNIIAFAVNTDVNVFINLSSPRKGVVLFTVIL